MLLAITLIAIVGTGAPVVILAIGTIYIPIFARVVRSSTLTVSTALYVDAARCRGASSARIVWQHVIPNAIGPALVQASILAGIAIQVEAALSFLGLGAQPPTPSLGVMLADGRDFLQQSPTLELFPGVAIAIAVCGFLLWRRPARPPGSARDRVSAVAQDVAALELSEVSVDFAAAGGPVSAVSDVSLTISRGESSASSASRAAARRRCRSPRSGCCRPARRSPARSA